MKIRWFTLMAVIIMAAPFAFGQRTLTYTADDRLFREGLELLNREKYAAARSAFEEYITLEEEHFRTSGVEDESFRTTEAEYYVALAAMYLHNPDAELLFKDFIEKYPYHSKSSVAYYQLGNFYYNNKKYEKAIEYFSKMNVDRLPNDKVTEALFKTGYSHFSIKQFDKALEYFNDVKYKNHSYTYAASYYAGYINFRNENYEDALSDLQDAGRHEEYEKVVPVVIATIYYRQNKIDKLLNYGQVTLESGKKVQDQDELYLLMGEGYFEKEQYDKATEFFKKYAEGQRYGLSPGLQYRFGYAAFHADEYPTAINHLKEVASDNDSLGQAASYYLGMSYLKEDNKQYALSALRQAGNVSFNEDIREESIFKYGKVNYDLKQYNEAITALKYFTGNYSDSRHATDARELLTQALMKTNNYEEAIEWLESADRRSLNMNTAYQRVTFYKGVQEFNSRNFRRAIELFDKSQQYPLNKDLLVESNFWEGEAYSVLNEPANAREAYARVFQNASGHSEFHLKSRYGIGYAYYKLGEYDRALTHFTEYVNFLRYKDNKLNYNDALLRLADILAYKRNYSEALRYYNEAISRGIPQADYAYFRRGLIQRINDNDEDALESFDNVINEYPNSPVRDDAYYHKARLYFVNGDYQDAINVFSHLITESPNSDYIPFALNYRGIAYRNLGQNDKAINDFRTVVRDYPTDNLAGEALASAQELMHMEGREADFEELRELYVANNPGAQSLVQIDYQSAKNLYNSGKYQQAVTGFTDYLEKYEETPYESEARYYLADSYLKSGDENKAIEMLKQLTRTPNPFHNRSVLKLADLYSGKGNFSEAKRYYRQYLANSQSERDRNIARAALMETYYQLENYDSVSYYANQIIGRGGGSFDANKASLYLGKAAYQQGELDTAIAHFENTINKAQDENAVESKYMIARVQYDREQYEQSLETLYDLNSTYSGFSDWLSRSFLLIADNFLAMDEDFQAKATLQSIIDHSKHQESVEKAKEKLAQIGGLSQDDTLQNEVPPGEQGQEQLQTDDTLQLQEEEVPNE